jgi:hypothetical protein
VEQRWFELSLGLPGREGGQASCATSVFPHLFLFPSWTDCSILARSTDLNRTDYQPWNRSAPDGWCDGRIREFFCQPLEAKQKYNNLIDGKHFQVQGYGNDQLLTQDQILDWTDRLHLRVELEDERNFAFWPEHPKSFRSDTLTP